MPETLGSSLLEELTAQTLGSSLLEEPIAQTCHTL